jgi:hypothetical protein
VEIADLAVLQPAELLNWALQKTPTSDLTSFLIPHISLWFIATRYADLQHRSGGKLTLFATLAFPAFPLTAPGFGHAPTSISPWQWRVQPIGGCHERLLQFYKVKDAGDVTVEKK